jgi:hypothetical protein
MDDLYLQESEELDWLLYEYIEGNITEEEALELGITDLMDEFKAGLDYNDY